ncbi:SH3 domain-containing protein [Aquicoccus sp. SCR17]|nr:SH3 domain-containing protein [Carideicomes alvinocaridis]
MWRFICLTFGFLAVTFYQLSGGANFQPIDRNAPQAGAAEAATAEAETDAAVPQDPTQTASRRAAERPMDDTVEGLGITLASMRAPASVPEASAQAARVSAPAGTPSAAIADTELASADDSHAFTFTAARSAARQDELPAAAASAPKARPEVVEVSLPRSSRHETREVIANVVNMRIGPSTGYSVLAQLNRGDRVEVLREPGNGWVKLRTVEGNRVGWMSARLLARAD